MKYKVGDIVVLKFNRDAYKDRIKLHGMTTRVSERVLWLKSKKGIYETEASGSRMWDEKDLKKATWKERKIFKQKEVEERI